MLQVNDSPPNEPTVRVAHLQTMVGSSWAEAGRIRGLTFFLCSFTDRVFIRKNGEKQAQTHGQRWRHCLQFAQSQSSLLLNNQDVLTCLCLWSPSVEVRVVIRLVKTTITNTGRDSLKLILLIPVCGVNTAVAREKFPQVSVLVVFHPASVAVSVWL